MLGMFRRVFARLFRSDRSRTTTGTSSDDLQAKHSLGKSFAVRDSPARLPPFDIEINDDYRRALEWLSQRDRSLFTTGRAGTGKSTFVRLLKSTTTQRFAVVAPTGVAALNAGGQTIHSFFKFAPGPIDPKKDIPFARSREVYKNLDLLIIDEISMVRADLLDGIDRFLRKNGKSSQLPFGGTQVLMVGDPFQLPPVVADEAAAQFLNARYASPYFFHSWAMKERSIPLLEFSKIYRQSDPKFIEILNGIRDMSDVDDSVSTLNERSFEGDDGRDDLITLTPTNRVADEINVAAMKALAGAEVSYVGRLEGKMPQGDKLPAPEHLVLKAGAQVMFVKNDGGKQWVNGSLGRVESLSEDSLTVSLADSQWTRAVQVKRETWQKVEHHYNQQTDRIEAKVVGTFSQFPLMPAWAITIHKSQGSTFEHVRIDMGQGAFAHGQLYVALSRCRTLEGIRLSQPIRTSDVICDPEVREYFAHAPRV